MVIFSSFRQRRGRFVFAVFFLFCFFLLSLFFCLFCILSSSSLLFFFFFSFFFSLSLSLSLSSLSLSLSLSLSSLSLSLSLSLSRSSLLHYPRKIKFIHSFILARSSLRPLSKPPHRSTFLQFVFVLVCFLLKYVYYTCTI